MPPPDSEQLKALEQTRQRLVRLTQSLAALIQNINSSDPLPPWPSLHSQAALISNALTSITTHLSAPDPSTSLSASAAATSTGPLHSLVAYPTPAFPGRTEAGMLMQLMRTRLEPAADEWVAHGREMGSETATGTGTEGKKEGNGGNFGNKTAAGSAAGVIDIDMEADPDVNAAATAAATHLAPLPPAALADLWRWAPLEANALARRRNWGGDYTLEEREAPGGVATVVTGLRRRLREREDEEEDEEDEEEEEDYRTGAAGAGPGHEGYGAPSALPLQDVFRFMMTGRMPRGRPTLVMR